MCRSNLLVSSNTTMKNDNKIVFKTLSPEHQQLSTKRQTKEIETVSDQQSKEASVISKPASLNVQAEEHKKISKAIRQQQAAVFVAHCNQEASKLQNLINDAKHQAMKQVLKARQAKAQQMQTAARLVAQRQPNLTKPSCSCNCCNANLKHSEALVKFVWSGSAHRVEVRFDLDNWQTPHLMTRSQFPGTWELAMVVPAMRRILFKFVVDGVWQTSSDYTTCHDGQFTNNTVMAVNVECAADAAAPVFVSSQLDSWSSPKPVNYCSARGTHATTLVLPGNWTGAFEFKFMVNGEWRLSTQHGATPNGYFSNNILFL